MLQDVDEKLINIFEKLPKNFWDFKKEDTKELTHSIHSYPAVMIYPISRTILSIVKKIQNINSVLDPFMGSGTVLLESLLAGIDNIYGNDLNPLSTLISRAKTTIIDINLSQIYFQLRDDIKNKIIKYNEELSTVDSYIKKNYDITSHVQDKNGWGGNASYILNKFLEKKSSDLKIDDIKGLGFWFVPRCILELQILKNLLLSIKDDNIRNYCFVTFSEIIRLVSNRRNGEFKMYRMPSKKIKVYCPKVFDMFMYFLLQNLEKMENLRKRLKDKKLGKIILSSENSAHLTSIPDDSIDLVITSPPYGDSRTTVAYGQFSRLSLQWCNNNNFTYKEIRDIDKNLMGGHTFKKGFSYNIKSKTLYEALHNIIADKNNLERAGDVYSFYKDLSDILKKVAMKCRKNSYQFWVVGNRTVKNTYLKTDMIIAEICSSIGLKHILTVHRNISNKVMPRLNSPTNECGKTVKTICEESIVILRKL